MTSESDARTIARSWLGLAADDLDTRRTFTQASLAGFLAPNLGEAFYEGYQAALRRLVPSLPAGSRASLCVTESGGGHPKAMLTELLRRGDGGAEAAELRLRGRKSFVTGAARATTLLVVAREGVREDGTPRLRVAAVHRDDADSAWPTGTTIEDLPKTPFAPEIPHSVAKLDDVRVLARDVLSGDGYLQYVKPFRTVEDIHVVGAIASHLVAFLRETTGSEARIEAWLACIAGLDALSTRDPSSAGVHVALAGILAALRSSIAELDDMLASHPSAARAADLRRDLALLRVAESARTARREAALRTLRG